MPRALLMCALCFCCACSQPPELPPPPPQPALEFLGEWGTPGDGPGQLSRPVSLTVDAVGGVYIADAGNGYIHKFDPQGRPLLSFQDALLKTPRGIAVDAGGGIYVTDFTGNQLFIFRTDGERYARIRRGRFGRLSGPSGVAVTAEGSFYVTDTDGLHVNRFDGRGRAVNSWGLRGDGARPRDVPSDVAFGPDGRVYVTDVGGAVVQRFGAEGPGSGEAGLSLDTREIKWDERKYSAVGLAVSDRYIFLAEEPYARILVWTLDGKLRLQHAVANRSAGGNKPVSIVDVAWSPRGELLVLDSAGARVLRFRVDLP